MKGTCIRRPQSRTDHTGTGLKEGKRNLEEADQERPINSWVTLFSSYAEAGGGKVFIFTVQQDRGGIVNTMGLVVRHDEESLDLDVTRWEDYRDGATAKHFTIAKTDSAFIHGVVCYSFLLSFGLGFGKDGSLASLIIDSIKSSVK